MGASSCSFEALLLLVLPNGGGSPAALRHRLLYQETPRERRQVQPLVMRPAISSVAFATIEQLLYFGKIRQRRKLSPKHNSWRSAAESADCAVKSRDTLAECGDVGAEQVIGSVWRFAFVAVMQPRLDVRQLAKLRVRSADSEKRGTSKTRKFAQQALVQRLRRRWVKDDGLVFFCRP